jgi:hypothetical protein
VRVLVFAPLLLAAAACGGSPRGTATTTKAAAARLHVAIVGQDHHPLVGKRWHYEVRVTAGGKPLGCRIRLQLLFGGAPVGELGVHVVGNGVWRETFGIPGNPPFPAAARGQPLVLEATVTARGYPRARAGWPIVVR